MITVRATSGAVLCCWRAARRRTGSHHKAHALTVRSAKECAGNRGAVLCGTDFPARTSEVSSEQVVQIGVARSGWSNARAMLCT